MLFRSRGDLAIDERFGSNALRVKHREVLEKQLAAMFREKPAAHWIETLQRGGIPVALVRNFEDVLTDEHSRERELFPEREHGQAGKVRVTGLPMKFSATPGSIGKAAPALGGQTDAVLLDLLGITSDEVRELRDAGVVGAS